MMEPIEILRKIMMEQKDGFSLQGPSGIPASFFGDVD
jgi:hypothetical protein